MKTDRQLQKDVIDELAYDPQVTAEKIGVSVTDHVVTLTGEVPTYAEKYAAEKATFRVAGVKAVAEEIAVKLPSSHLRTDADIAKAAANSIEWNSTLPSEIHVSVEKGNVILRGKVDWGYQREAAANAVRFITGVTGITNHIAVVAKARPEDIKQRIEKALKRMAEEDAKKICVESVDGEVVLTGIVHSRLEAENAKWAAWATPGVTRVDNRLSVS